MSKTNMALKSTSQKPGVNIEHELKWTKNELLVFGYLHCNFGRNGRYNDVSTIIYEYISYEEMWNTQSLNDKYMECPVPYITVKRIPSFNGFWYNTFGAVTISEPSHYGSFNKYIWKLRYKSIDYRMNCMIGISANSEIPRLQNSNFYCFYDRNAFGLTQNGDIINGGKIKKYSNKEFLSGDVITMQLIFEQTNRLNVSFSINEEYLGTAFYIECDHYNYNLAVSLNDCNTSVCIEYFHSVNDAIYRHQF